MNANRKLSPAVITEKDCKQSTQYAKFCVVEACRAEQNRGMEQATGARNDDGIYERLPIAFLGQMNCSACTNAKRRTRVCANIVCREIRP